MQIIYGNQRDQVSINIDINLQELQFLRQHEPVAWANLMAGIERVGYVLSGIDVAPMAKQLAAKSKYGQDAEVP